MEQTKRWSLLSVPELDAAKGGGKCPFCGGFPVYCSDRRNSSHIGLNTRESLHPCNATYFHPPLPVTGRMLREQNPEHLLIFAAGNDGGLKDIATREVCTVLSPALGKNSLAVGATSSGPSGGTTTGADGRLIYDVVGIPDYSVEGYPWICINPYLGAPSSSTEQADIDTIAWFSSYGPAADGRIKPEVLAPGDQVRHGHGNLSFEASRVVRVGISSEALILYRPVDVVSTFPRHQVHYALISYHSPTNRYPSQKHIESRRVAVNEVSRFRRFVLQITSEKKGGGANLGGSIDRGRGPSKLPWSMPIAHPLISRLL